MKSIIILTIEVNDLSAAWWRKLYLRRWFDNISPWLVLISALKSGSQKAFTHCFTTGNRCLFRFPLTFAFFSKHCFPVTPPWFLYTFPNLSSAQVFLEDLIECHDLPLRSLPFSYLSILLNLAIDGNHFSANILETWKDINSKCVW